MQHGAAGIQWGCSRDAAGYSRMQQDKSFIGNQHHHDSIDFEGQYNAGYRL